LSFYSSVEPNSYACATSLFLIGKISINVRIFQNPPRVRILFILGLYGLGLIVRRKSFPFRVSWRPHNDQLSAVWPFDSSTLGPFTSDQFTVSPFVSHCQVHLKGSVTSNFLPLQCNCVVSSRLSSSKAIFSLLNLSFFSRRSIAFGSYWRAMLRILLQRLALTPINVAYMTSIMPRGGGFAPPRLPDTCLVVLPP